MWLPSIKWGLYHWERRKDLDISGDQEFLPQVGGLPPLASELGALAVMSMMGADLRPDYCLEKEIVCSLYYLSVIFLGYWLFLLTLFFWDRILLFETALAGLELKIQPGCWTNLPLVLWFPAYVRVLGSVFLSFCDSWQRHLSLVWRFVLVI